MPWSTADSRSAAACSAGCSADMLFSTLGQLPVFLWMMAAGAVIGAWYVALAGLRRLICAGFWLSLAADIGFGIGAAAIFCAALYLANYGRFRLFVAAAATLGLSLFMGGVYPPARWLFRHILRTMWRLCDKCREFRWSKVIFR